MYILLNAIFLILGIIWGDWKNWKKYYPTILFFMIGDFLYNVLLYKQTMWLFHDLILPNHTTISLLSMFVSYSATVLIYLGRFPVHRIKRVWWYLLWVGLYITMEFINSKFGFITYHNGWNIWWSLLFTGIIFIILPIHQKWPLIAWLCSFGVVITLIIFFDVDIAQLK